MRGFVWCECSFGGKCFRGDINVPDAQTALDVARHAKCPKAIYTTDGQGYGDNYIHIYDGEISINLEFIGPRYRVPVSPFVADMYLIWRGFIRMNMRILELKPPLDRKSPSPGYECHVYRGAPPSGPLLSGATLHGTILIARNTIYFNGTQVKPYRPFKVDYVKTVIITGYEKAGASTSSFVALSMAIHGGDLLY